MNYKYEKTTPVTPTFNQTFSFPNCSNIINKTSPLYASYGTQRVSLEKIEKDRSQNDIENGKLAEEIHHLHTFFIRHMENADTEASQTARPRQAAWSRMARS